MMGDYKIDPNLAFTENEKIESLAKKQNKKQIMQGPILSFVQKHSLPWFHSIGAHMHGMMK
jgi:hypothetical protein